MQGGPLCEVPLEPLALLGQTRLDLCGSQCLQYQIDSLTFSNSRCEEESNIQDDVWAVERGSGLNSVAHWQLVAI